ncbi:putative thiol:disulfide interchange protein I [Gluconobacter morbifer G707]|uniref:Putative thiol:disulfide interchange protein I n=2 Tax=Gluconobacter TaxID=441 RepID=G6XGP7_9PROT|nr:putative thiol:disulfide interchange protein I [Gluconobacter morbifer G707]
MPYPLARLRPGRPMHEPIALTLTGLNGATRSLTQERGRPFLLHLWATWCGPCKEELPALNRFLGVAGQDHTVVPVAVASPLPKVEAYLQAGNLPGIQPWTVDLHALTQWLALPQPSLPMTCFMDAQGRLRASVEGPVNWGAADAVDVFHNLVASLEK